MYTIDSMALKYNLLIVSACYAKELKQQAGAENNPEDIAPCYSNSIFAKHI